MRIKIMKLHPDAIIPKYAHPGDAGMDLYSIEPVVLAPGERKSIPTGIAMEIPDGYVGLIWDKSGLSHRFGLKTLGGVIDSIFRGELQVGVINLSKEPIKFDKGHKIAQLLIQKIEIAELDETDEISDSSRGDKGFGSTGK